MSSDNKVGAKFPTFPNERAVPGKGKVPDVGKMPATGLTGPKKK